MASAADSSATQVDWTHILVETSSLDDVKGALRGSSRLKYTCLDVSSKFLVLGSNTGSVYVFGRASQKHPQIIFPEIDPAQVNCVSISPTDKAVAFSTVRGHVVVVELNSDRRQKPEKLRIINDHVQTTVTCITWDKTGSKLYTADSNGRTFVTSIQSSKVQNLVSLPPEVILKLESPICQVDLSEDKLLVSTLNKCYLCYTSRQKFTHIGSKPRDGEYGACFYRHPSTGLYRIYCARPGSRIWEVDIECNVLCTHMFKQLLAVPALPLVSSVDYSWQRPKDAHNGPQSLAFLKLKTTRENFLLTWSKNNVYVLDPVNVKVIFWTDLGSEIQNVVSSEGYLFIFYFNGNVQKTKIYLIPQCVSFLIAKNSWILAAEICSYFHVWIEKMRWKKYVSQSDIEKLKVHCKSSGNESLVNIIENMILTYTTFQDSGSELEDSFSDRSRSSSNASIQKLESGIYRINSQNSLLSPEIISIPEDFQKGLTTVDSPLLKNLKSEIFDLMDNTSHEVVAEKVDNKGKHGSLSHDSCTTTNISDIQPELASILSYSEDSENYLDEKNSKLESELDVKEIGEKRTVIKNEVEIVNNTHPVLPNSNALTNGDKTSETDIISLKSLEDASDGMNFEFKNENSIIDEDQDQKKDKKMLKNDNPELNHVINQQEVMEPLSEEVGNQPVVSLTEDDVTPLIVPTGSPIKKKKSRKKKMVNDVILDEDLDKFQKKEMKRSKSMGSISKTAEKKFPRGQSFNEPLLEETTQPIDIENKQNAHNIAEDSKSLGDGSQESSPPSSLTHSWESSGSETLAGQRRKSLTSKIDSVQSKLATTKNKFLQAIRQSKLSRSPGREGKSTPDSLSLDSVEGIIISAEKVQKDLEIVVPIRGPIDLSDLQKSTEETQMMLQDINILLNPIELQRILSDWIKQLNQSLCQLHTFIYVERLRKYHCCPPQNVNSDEKDEISHDNNDICENVNNSGVQSSRVNDEGETRSKNVDKLSLGSSQSVNSSQSLNHLMNWIEGDSLDFGSICHVTDPFLMATDLHQNVAELAQMCFDCGCFGDISNFTFPSHKNLCQVQLCEKCKEMLDADKVNMKALYNIHQRDSGFSENGERKRDFKETGSELLANNCDVCDSENKEITIDKKCNKDDLSHDNLKDKNISENDSRDLQVESLKGHTYLENEENNVNTKDNESTDELESLSCPQSSTDSDKSLPSVSEEDQNLSSSLNNDGERSSSQMCDKDTCPKDLQDEYTELVETQKIGTSNELKHHQCSYCHQAHVICFHDNHFKEGFSEIQRFIEVYFFLLDVEKVKNKAYCCEEASYKVWCGLVNGVREYCREDILFVKIEEELSTAYELLRLGEFQPNKMLGYLSRLFEINPNKAVDIFIGGSTIYPVDVLYFCDLYSLPPDKYFYKYMKVKVTENNGHKLYGNKVVVNKWIEILLTSANHNTVIDQNGNPRSWSHLEKWNDQDIIDHVISLTTEHTIQHHMQLCKQTGYWSGYLTLLKRQERYQDMLTIILHLQDVEMLDCNKVNGTLPATLEDWNWFLGQFSSLNHQNRITKMYSRETSNVDLQSDHNRINDLHSKLKDDQDTSYDQTKKGAPDNYEDDNNHTVKHMPITWDNIGQLMIQNLGPVTTVQLIQECGLTDEVFSPTFFQSCVLSSFIHRQQRNVTHSLLEKLDSYLWTKKPSTLMPELQYLVSSEKEGSADDTKEDAHDSILYLTSDQSFISKQYKEDMESHWGTSTKINRNCRNCNIQLTETVSHVEPGVLVFPCGHGFHKFCCPLRECILCTDLE